MKNIVTKFPVTDEFVALLQNVLNENLADLDLGSLTLSKMMNIERQMKDYGFLASPVIKSIYEALSEDTEGERAFFTVLFGSI